MPIPLIRILLIEDDEDDYILTEGVLAEARPNGYALTWLTDYHAGLAAVRRMEHDICLLDYRLGAHTGLDFLREMQATEHDMPIIVLTGMADRAIDMEVMRAGASDYLVKSELEPIMLERALRYAWQQKKTAGQRVKLAREAEARHAAEAANRAKDEFIAMISHELRTPLNAVIGWSKLLRSGRLPPAKIEQGLVAIENSSRTQSQLIEDLLDFSRILSGKFSLQIRPVEPATLIQSAIATVQPSAEAKNLELVTHLATEVKSLPADATRLVQTLVNLLNNAVKFTPAGGRITLEVADVSPDAVRFTVTDTGQGISSDFLPHVFERYRQAEETPQRQKGLGLGLPIVHHIVGLHKGSVNAHSDGLGQGATFTITLPVRNDE